MKIRFCEHNKGKGKVVRRLQDEYPDLDIKVKDCVNECDACKEKPMALLGKARVTARDGDNLYRKIVKIITKE